MNEKCHTQKKISNNFWNFFETEKPCAFSGGSKFADYAADYAMIWRAAFEQKSALVCLSYSGEIIGLNVNYVITKNETFLKDVRNVVSTTFVV